RHLPRQSENRNAREFAASAAGGPLFTDRSGYLRRAALLAFIPAAAYRCDFQPRLLGLATPLPGRSRPHADDQCSGIAQFAGACRPDECPFSARLDERGLWRSDRASADGALLG